MDDELRKTAESILVGGGDSPEWRRCQAVARAYLAQSDLLAACKAMLAAWVREAKTGGVSADDFLMLEVAHAAIAKAEGGEACGR